MIETSHTPTASLSPEESGANRRRSLWLWLLLLGLALTFLIDQSVMAAIEPVHRGRLAVLISHTVKWLGTRRFQFLVLALLMLFGALRSRPLRRAAGWSLCAFLASGAAAHILKLLVHRPRPYVTGASPTDLGGSIRNFDYQSFPSADTSTVFAIAATMGHFLPVTRLPLLVAAVAVGLGRVVVGAHHPSDVWAGAMLGLAVGRLVVQASRPGVLRRAARCAWPFALLTIYAGVVLFAGLGRLPLYGRDESLYAEAAREMLVGGDWITPRVNGEPFLEKPPLYYWLVAACYHAFGLSPLSARLPAALMSLATVLLTALLAGRVWGRRAGLLAGIALASSLQVGVIGRMGIMDAPLMCLTTLALMAYAVWRQGARPGAAAAFGVLVALGVLLKGAAGALPLIIVLVHLTACRPLPRRVSPWSVVLSLTVAVAVVLPYFLAIASRQGESFGMTFLWEEHLRRIVKPMQGHHGLPTYYLALILLSFFPWVVFLPAAMRGRREEDAAQFWHSLALVWFWAVLIPFSLVSTKLPGYITPLFPAMALLAGSEMDRRLQQPGRAPWIAALLGAAMLAVFASMVPALGVRYGAPLGAASEAGRLVLPTATWASAYGIIALGAALALARRVKLGIGVMTVGQTVALTALLAGVLPLLSPYMDGAREYRLAQLAQRELPHLEVVLYRARPEAVNFVLGHRVAVFERGQEQELLQHLAGRPVALITPANATPAGVEVERRWEVGNYLLAEVGS